MIAVRTAPRSMDAISKSSSGECAPLPVAPRPSSVSRKGATNWMSPPPRCPAGRAAIGPRPASSLAREYRSRIFRFPGVATIGGIDSWNSSVALLPGRLRETIARMVA